MGYWPLSALIYLALVLVGGGTRTPCYCLSPTLSGLIAPVSVTFYQEGRHEMVLVAEQQGLVSKYRLSGSRVGSFLDIRDRVSLSEEPGDSRGLLALVLDPGYTLNGNVYVYYIRNESGHDYSYVSEFRTAGGTVDPKSELTLLRLAQPDVTGNGGPMLFGDDGYLYIFTGDGGEEHDPHGRAQNLSSIYGKVLRIDVSKHRGESAANRTYAIPDSNPLINTTGARKEIFASGIRNMWGCSQDSIYRPGGSGRILCAETGTTQFDEINIIEKGKNYGWNLVEGHQCLHSNKCSPIENEGRPIFTFQHTSSHALVGGVVYRGKSLAGLTDAGFYLYGDVISGKTYLLQESGGKWKNQEWGTCPLSSCPVSSRQEKPKHILGFGQDLQGEVYLLTSSSLQSRSSTGQLLKLVSSDSCPELSRPSSLLQTALLLLAVLALEWSS